MLREQGNQKRKLPEADTPPEGNGCHGSGSSGAENLEPSCRRKDSKKSYAETMIDGYDHNDYIVDEVEEGELLFLLRVSRRDRSKSRSCNRDGIGNEAPSKEAMTESVQSSAPQYSPYEDEITGPDFDPEVSVSQLINLSYERGNGLILLFWVFYRVTKKILRSVTSVGKRRTTLFLARRAKTNHIVSSVWQSGMCLQFRFFVRDNYFWNAQ